MGIKKALVTLFATAFILAGCATMTTERSLVQFKDNCQAQVFETVDLKPVLLKDQSELNIQAIIDIENLINEISERTGDMLVEATHVWYDWDVDEGNGSATILFFDPEVESAEPCVPNYGFLVLFNPVHDSITFEEVMNNMDYWIPMDKFHEAGVDYYLETFLKQEELN
jgi:hypothetical protein